MAVRGLLRGTPAVERKQWAGRYPTLVEFFEHTVVRCGERPALKAPRFTGGGYRALSYDRLNELAERCAAGLQAHGIGKGDKVAILSRPRVEWAAVMLGALKLGAVVVPLDPLLGQREIRRLLAATEAKAVIAAGDLIALTQGVGSLILAVSMDPGQPDNLLSWGEFTAEARLGPQPPPPSLADLAFFICTSGTTGDAKVVMLTHENLSSNLSAVFDRLGITPRDTVMTIAPWNHIMGLIILLASFWQGAGVVYSDDYRNLTQLMRENRATLLTAVPKLYHSMFAKIESAIQEKPLSRWLYQRAPRLLGRRLKQKLLGRQFRFFVCGSAPLAPAVAAGFRRLGLGMIQGYGMSETSPVLTFTTPLTEKADSVGEPLANLELKIANPDQEGVGEVLVRGPNVMRGYYKNPQRTRQVLQPDGWLHTGDLGLLDREGWLTIRGRSKNVIVLETGKNVYPEEIEWELCASPYIEEILVRGGQRQGLEVILAFVYPQQEAITKLSDPAEIKRLIWEEIKRYGRNLASYKRIRSEKDLIIVDQPFVKTSTLDIKRYLYHGEVSSDKD